MTDESPLAQVLAAATARLSQAGLAATSLQDAQLLLMHVLGCDRTHLLAYPERIVTHAELASYDELISRREKHEPVQYITGRVEFYGLALRVDRNVLIPRPETEHLVEALLARISPAEHAEIVDIGTGSGAVAIAIARSRPNVTVTATDISPSALAVARANAEAHNLAARISFIQTDLLAGIASGVFDAVVSNPPYVGEEDRATLARQVHEYEPATAFFAGPDGFDIYERLIPEAERVLKPSGWLLMEIGYGQQSRIAELLAGWNDVSFVADLQEIPRVACARRP